MTLLEVLVAMALSSMIMLMVATTLATSVRASGQTAVDVQQGGREDRGRALLSAQMSWIELIPESREPRSFVGRSTFVEFGTLISARLPHERRSTRCRYMVLPAESGDGVRIVYMEWPNARARSREAADEALDALQRRLDEQAEAQTTQAPPAMTATVVDGCASAQMSYLFIGPSAERLWDLDWNDPRSLPRAVRISWTTKEGVEGEWIVPVVATF